MLATDVFTMVFAIALAGVAIYYTFKLLNNVMDIDLGADGGCGSWFLVWFVLIVVGGVAFFLGTFLGGFIGDFLFSATYEGSP